MNSVDAETAEYRAVLDELARRGRFGIRLGLARTRALLRELGEPDVTLRGALIAGTNGKGSVQQIVASVLRCAGHRVGQTPSPHLTSYRERIVVDGAPIGGEAFTLLLREVLAAAERVAPRLGHPTEFEILTPAAFAFFARSGVEVGVIEVGIGGRLDATNAWDGGVAVVTNVGWDHADRLGPTIPAIAREKAAIIKPGNICVTGATGEGLEVVRGRVSDVRAQLVETAPLEVLGMGRLGLQVAAPGLGELRLGLLGRHQAANAAVALETIRALAQRDIVDAPDEAIRDGFSTVRWPGRLELLTLGGDGSVSEGASAALGARGANSVDLVLDGAHNRDGADALAAALDELADALSPGEPTLLLGVMADKDISAIVDRFLDSPYLRRAHVLATQLNSPRALAASDLAAAWQAHGGPGAPASVGATESVAAALEAGIEGALRRGGPLIVAGSLYLIGEVRGRLGLGLS
ncbi:MAG: bifunctional folylpolyglutamate synthase/dihydrofolate synthase [Chloroflexi bacterium]|nr:bifunctional folylpolyglutamate synthase/dihydrofolate synthase [Chloroflexota bacterium]